MRILAIDTATERCSVALSIDGQIIERSAETPRAHADLVLPMVESVLHEAGVSLRDLNGIAYGRGPGAFTGVRIAIGVVQGLAFGSQQLTVGISNLAAVAQQVARPGARILVCMDARMGEVYTGAFICDAAGRVAHAGPEQVVAPAEVAAGQFEISAGTGLRIFPELARGEAHADLLPRAREIALLGAVALRAGEGRPAAAAQPVYLRDRVVADKR